MEAQVSYKYIKDRSKSFMYFWSELFKFCEDLTYGWWGAQGGGYYFLFKRNNVEFNIFQYESHYAIINYEGTQYYFSNIEEINDFCLETFGIEFK